MNSESCNSVEVDVHGIIPGVKDNHALFVKEDDMELTFKKHKDAAYTVLADGQEIGNVQGASETAKGWRFSAWLSIGRSEPLTAEMSDWPVRFFSTRQEAAEALYQEWLSRSKADSPRGDTAFLDDQAGGALVTISGAQDGVLVCLNCDEAFASSDADPRCHRCREEEEALIAQ